MSRKKRRETPQWRWEQALLADYYDYRWHAVLDPLYEQFQLWKAGERTHDDMDRAIHQVHRQTQQLFSFFSEKRDWLVLAIQFDHDWFDAWVAGHPPPAAEEQAPGAADPL
jgi:hypothetical protein